MVQKGAPMSTTFYDGGRNWCGPRRGKWGRATDCDAASSSSNLRWWCEDLSRHRHQIISFYYSPHNISPTDISSTTTKNDFGDTHYHVLTRTKKLADVNSKRKYHPPRWTITFLYLAWHYDTVTTPSILKTAISTSDEVRKKWLETIGN